MHHFGALGFGHGERVICVCLWFLMEVVQFVLSNFLIGLSGRQDFAEGSLRPSRNFSISL